MVSPRAAEQDTLTQTETIPTEGKKGRLNNSFAFITQNTHIIHTYMPDTHNTVHLKGKLKWTQMDS